MTAVPGIYQAHLDAITGPRPESVRELWEPDGVLEFPYAVSVGSPTRLDGVDAIVDYFSGSGMFTGFSFRDMRAWKIEDRDEYVLEVHGSATIAATGAAYEQDYIVRFGLSPRGRLTWMREFWDPTRA